MYYNFCMIGSIPVLPQTASISCVKTSQTFMIYSTQLTKNVIFTQFNLC